MIKDAIKEINPTSIDPYIIFVIWSEFIIAPFSHIVSAVKHMTIQINIMAKGIVPRILIFFFSFLKNEIYETTIVIMFRQPKILK